MSVFLKTYLRVLHEDRFLWDWPQTRNCSQCWELTNIRSDPSIGISANIDEAQGNGARWAGAKAVALKRTSPGQISCTGSPRAAWHWLFVGDDGLRGCDLSERRAEEPLPRDYRGRVLFYSEHLDRRKQLLSYK
jgi:hypothetical protein